MSISIGLATCCELKDTGRLQWAWKRMNVVVNALIYAPILAHLT